MRPIDADRLLHEMRTSGRAAYLLVMDAPTIETDVVAAYQNGRAAAVAELRDRVKGMKATAMGAERHTLDAVLRLIEKMEA